MPHPLKFKTNFVDIEHVRAIFTKETKNYTRAKLLCLIKISVKGTNSAELMQYNSVLFCLAIQLSAIKLQLGKNDLTGHFLAVSHKARHTNGNWV